MRRDEIIAAGVQPICAHRGSYTWETLVGLALDAMAPLIRADIAEEIAQAIEASDERLCRDYDCGELDADIARQAAIR